MQLEAERSTSLELGIKKEFDGGSFITLSAYRTETREAIEYVYLWNKDTPVEDLTFADNLGDTYLNTSRQVVNGVEVEGNASLGKFSLLGNISWIDGYIYVKPSDLDATETGGNHVQLFNYGVFVTNEFEVDKLVRRPNLTAYVQLSFAFRADLSACVAYRHAGSRFDSGYDESLGPYGALNQFEVRKYNLIDLAMNWDIREDLALGLKVENLFDESYQEILGFQTRGRSAYVKLSYSW
jgi:vitamin B12 transporter